MIHHLISSFVHREERRRDTIKKREGEAPIKPIALAKRKSNVGVRETDNNYTILDITGAFFNPHLGNHRVDLIRMLASKSQFSHPITTRYNHH